jgi:UDP-perosamine 4-acetyltransferase
VKLLVVGAGGHAKVVLDAARAAGFDIAGVVGTRSDKKEVAGHPVTLDANSVRADGFIVAIGDNRARARVFGEYVGMGLRPITVIHPSTTLAETVSVGAGTFVAAGVVVNSDAVIGDNAILNTSCVVEHDVVVGDHALIGPNSSLCGAVRIGDGVLVGAGCTARPMISIGSWAVCGAGSVVVSDVPPATVCFGVPARPVRGIEE